MSPGTPKAVDFKSISNLTQEFHNSTNRQPQGKQKTLAVGGNGLCIMYGII